MKIPKEIADKIELRNKLKEEILEFIKENDLGDDCTYYKPLEVVDMPTGTEQEEGVFVDQKRQWEDWFTGFEYVPIEGTDKYLKFAYEC